MEQQVGEPFQSLDDAVCRATLEELLAAEPRTTALFAGNDRVALVLLKHLSAMGRREAAVRKAASSCRKRAVASFGPSRHSQPGSAEH
jgi:hypothetical protein